MKGKMTKNDQSGLSRQAATVRRWAKKHGDIHLYNHGGRLRILPTKALVGRYDGSVSWDDVRDDLQHLIDEQGE